MNSLEKRANGAHPITWLEKTWVKDACMRVVRRALQQAEMIESRHGYPLDVDGRARQAAGALFVAADGKESKSVT